MTELAAAPCAPLASEYLGAAQDVEDSLARPAWQGEGSDESAEGDCADRDSRTQKPGSKAHGDIVSACRNPHCQGPPMLLGGEAL